MKIVSIHFKNINSLKGEHAVYFDQQPLSDSGIFAITGPTGAGKSTLLDVISLALFNQVPRFSAKITKNGLIKNGSLITHNTKDAYAKIVYRIKSEEYTSVWSIAYNSKGNLNDYNMTIFKPDGVPFDLNKSNVPAKNEAIIGLNYQQFVKSIMLSQGEFARFLKAGKNERGKLLENITGTEIYRDLGMHCNKIYKDLSTTLEAQKKAWEAIKTLDKDALKLLKEQYATSIEKQKSASKELLIIQNIRHAKQAIDQHEKALQLALNQKIELSEAIKAFEPQAQKISQHQQLSALAVDFNTYKQAKKQIVKAKHELQSLNQKQQEKDKALQQVLNEASELTAKSVNQHNFSGMLAAFEKEVQILDNQLHILVEKGGLERQNINKKIKAQAQNIDARIQPAVAINQLEETNKICKASLIKMGIEVFDKARQEQLNASLLSLRDNLIFLQEWSVLLQQKVKNDTAMNDQTHKKKDIHGKIEGSAPLLKEKSKVKTLIEDKIQLLQNQKENALKMASMDMHRASLKPGEACPLCGSEEHPYVHQLPKNELHQFEKELKLSQTALEEASGNVDLLRKKQIEWNNTLQIIEKQIKLLEAEQQNLLAAIEQKKNEYTGNSPLPNKIEKDFLQGLNAQLHQKEQALRWLQDIEFNRALIEDFEQLQKILSDHAVLKTERGKLYKGPSVQGVVLDLNKHFNTIQLNLNSIHKELQQQTQIKVENTEIFDRLQSQLSKDIQHYGLNAIDDLSTKLLTPQQLQALTEQKEALFVRQTELETQIKTHQQHLKEQKALDALQELSLQQVVEQESALIANNKNLAASIGSCKAQLDRDKADKQRIEQLKVSSEPLIKKVAKWKKLQLLIGDANGNKFSNFAQTLTLQNLLVYANKRIQKLTDRYLIIPPQDDGSLRVLDQYHGNISRSVSTLSGGETFLVSLALALSLSDMASKTVSIDSLFIDEGFSTLDSEAQQMALDTLDNLQSVSQKTIGVISHVEALKSRIQVQIQLKKNAQGYSSLEIVDGSE